MTHLVQPVVFPPRFQLIRTILTLIYLCHCCPNLTGKETWTHSYELFTGEQNCTPRIFPSVPGTRDTRLETPIIMFLVSELSKNH